ncbi:sortase [Burkholderia pyrrocinia]|uniref:Sortase n=1 Tax=Burkholderia pyrrocinia TaxID=60550 RepID=A0A2Z5N2E3_BURPY|nr:sortase [Burkholderia pyrrocinia]
MHKLANKICGEPARFGPGARRVPCESPCAAVTLTVQGPRIESPFVSGCYAPHRRDIHRLANTFCGQLAIDCVATVEDRAGRSRRAKPVRTGCPMSASAR